MIQEAEMTEGQHRVVVWSTLSLIVGATLVVFDLRFRFTDWYQQIDFLGKEVLPAFV